MEARVERDLRARWFTSAALPPDSRIAPSARHSHRARRARSTLLRLVENDHSDAADSFCAGCLTGADRVAAVRRAAFLRRKYASRRLRFTRTRCFCPMESLSIENRRKAIGIENRSHFFPDTGVFASLSLLDLKS